MHNISQTEIFNFVFNNFVNTFSKNKEQFNFLHTGKKNDTDLIFFISTKTKEFKEVLSNTEFEYATGDLSKFLNVSFCFLEEDMEKDLSNTEKIAL